MKLETTQRNRHVKRERAHRADFHEIEDTTVQVPRVENDITNMGINLLQQGH